MFSAPFADISKENFVNLCMQELATGHYSGNIIERSEQRGFICCHTSYLTEKFNPERHFHQNAHFSFVLSGYCAEKKKDTAQRGPGDLAFYHRGEPHQVIGVSKDSRHINVEVSQGLLDRFDLAESSLERAYHLTGTKFSMLRMHQELQFKEQADTEFLLLEMLSAPGTGGPKPEWVTTVDHYLKDNLILNTSLATLAGITDVHPVTISKYFRRHFGCTLSAYQRKLKTEKALWLIKATPAPLTDIAYSCGFADQSHFNRSFKELTGMLPGTYRAL